MKRIFGAVYSCLPLSVRNKIRSVRNKIRTAVQSPLYTSQIANVFHCTIQRAGSQWIRKILSDRRVYTYGGLLPFTYEASLPGGLDPRGLTERTITHPFPKRTIATPLYIDYKGYKQIPKPEDSKAIFVVRDPRDLVISEYFSLRYSHSPIGEIPQIRQQLGTLTEPDGLLYVLEYLHSYGTFACQHSWIKESADPQVLIVRFEDLVAEHNHPVFEKVFKHFDIQIPKPVLSQLLLDYSFESLSGRRRGVEDKHTHYRKGIHGDWENHFDERLVKKFKQLTGDLVARLGYESDDLW